MNGEFFSKKEASISVFDRGFLFSDSVYEVTAVLEGNLVDWKDHFARLIRSLGHLNLENNFQEEDFYQIQKKLINENQLKEGLCYVQVTRGVAERDFNFAKKSLLPTVVIFTQEKQILKNAANKSRSLAVFYERVASLDIELKDVLYDLSNKLNFLESNPSLLEKLNNKMVKIQGLFQKHQVDNVIDLILIRDKLEKKLFWPSKKIDLFYDCLLYTSPSPRDLSTSRMPSSA